MLPATELMLLLKFCGKTSTVKNQKCFSALCPTKVGTNF